jgi:Zn-dependent protease with chaperone function
MPALPADLVAAEKRKQEITQLRDYYAQLHRLDTVAFRIRTANKEYCKGWVSAQIGLLAVTPQSLPRKFRSFSAEALDLRWIRATVISVVDGSPADKAGIRAGDELISLNNELVPVTGTPGWIGRFLKANGERPVRVSFRRDDTTNMMLTVEPVIGCAIPVVLETNPEPGAHTDYKKIVVQSGILRLTRTDADLATIVGHELAHVNMDHYQKKLQNTVVGAVGGLLVDGSFLLGGISTGGAFFNEFGKAGARAFSVAFEREADYVGAYYATRAGYDIAGAEQIWRALSLESPESMRIAATHPTTPQRFVFMQKTIAEIAEKQRRHLPLVPELKITQAQSDPQTAPEQHF